MNFLELIKKRKSVRSFTDKNVPRELIEKVIESATYAPTNCNQQLFNFTVVEKAALRERLIKEAASNTLIRRAPVVIVVSYDGWNYKEAIQGGALAVGHMLLAASELGLGSLPMNSYGADSKIRKILNIPETQTICCFVVLGYPDRRAKEAFTVPRRDVKNVIHWGEFSSKRQISFQYDPEKWTKEDLINHQRFYCRKTFLGKEMDIMSVFERDLVHEELKSLKGQVLDLMSYDGAYLREFPENVSLTTLDLCRETAEYSKVAASLSNREVDSRVLGDKSTLKQSFDASTILYKLERVPAELRKELYETVSGDLYIISRKRNIFLSFYFFLIRMIFGPDIRKTGIYTFFGPYKPISLSATIGELRGAGFKDITWSGYFALPAFFEQVYQMALQYRASEGSSYLHRERRSDIISRLISFLLRLQGLKKVGRFGSVVVIKCHK